MKVSILHPTGVLIWMSATTPAPQLAPDLEIHAVECTAGNTVSMIVRPSTDDRIEPNDQVRLCCRLVSLDYFPDLCQERLSILLGGRYQQFAAILPEVLAEEVESILNASHVSFFR